MAFTDELAKQDHFNNANIVPIDRDISKYATHVSEAFTFNSYTHNKPLQLMLNHFQRTDINWNLTRITKSSWTKSRTIPSPISLMKILTILRSSTPNMKFTSS
ncbi:hypothetical protein GLOIN_2v1690433 [Rhizophagus irregularis DAOM 181602=DAOM 197198]|nr:hypothetical protein GLOIN_2v1690433 [Rhizophagus irregularis DAOM 181602=DAOM 197198]